MSNIIELACDGVVAYATKKGDVVTTSIEGALFKGGAALSALKDKGAATAAAKAAAGRYGPAADIIEAAFPQVGKAVRSLHGLPALNAENFRALLSGVERAPEPKKGFSAKQRAVKALVAELRTIKTLAKASDERTIEALAA